MANYLQIFRFLWRIKRVESSLSSLWQRSMNTNKILGQEVPELKGILHKCSLLRSEMHHVTTILLSYMMYEVLETGWSAGPVRCHVLDFVQQHDIAGS